MASLGTLKKAKKILEKQPQSIRDAQAGYVLYNDSLELSHALLSDIFSDNAQGIDASINGFYHRELTNQSARSNTSISCVYRAITNIQAEIDALENGGPKPNEYC